MADAENSPSLSSLSKINKIIGIVIALLTGWAAFQSTLVKNSAVQGVAIAAVAAAL